MDSRRHSYCMLLPPNPSGKTKSIFIITLINLSDGPSLFSKPRKFLITCRCYSHLQTRDEVYPKHCLASNTTIMSSSQKGLPSSPSAASLSASKPVNSTVLYRYSTLLAIQILKRIRPREGNVLMLTDGLCVEYGRRVHLSEASTMRFISQYISIPVPKVLCAFTRSGWTYIVMERIKGDIIGSG